MATSRRTFLRASLGAASAVSFEAGRELLAAGEGVADVLLKNGAIVTMSDALPIASAMAVKGDKVLAVGAEKALGRYVGRATRTIDLKGRGVSPGLIDAHSHLIGFGQMELMYVLLRPPKVHDFASLNRALAAAARQRPRGQWIIGRGFQEFREGRFPRRQELDKAVPHHPVLIIHWGGQFGVANTLAMQTADLLRKGLADPYGGKYLRDRRTGLPDGVLVHYPAIYAVHKPVLSEAEQMKCARWATRKFAEQGVTCVHDNFVYPKYAASYVRLERMGELPVRVRVYPYVWNLQHVKLLVSRMRRYRGPLVRMQGVKLAVDGYALMYKTPERYQHLSKPMHPPDQFLEIIRTIHDAGLQVDVHAVGDKGVDWTLEAFSKSAGGDRAVRQRRHRIEHFPFRKLDSIKRAADMGVAVCTQPTIIDVRAEDFLKKFSDRATRKLVDTMIPLRSFLRQGVRLSFGADVPAFPSHSPLDSIRTAMYRRTPAGRRLDTSEAISFLDALKIHTAGGAWASFDEDEIGALEPGKLADFVIWNTDLRTVRSAGAVGRLRAMATYVGGQKVYDRAEARRSGAEGKG